MSGICPCLILRAPSGILDPLPFGIAIALTGLLAVSAPAAISVTAVSRSIRPGELVVLTIATTEPAASVHVRAFDRTLQPFAVDARTWQVLVGIDLGVTPGTYPVDIDTGAGGAVDRTTYRLVVTPRTFPKRTLTVEEAFVNPPPAALEQIERDTQQLNRIWAAPAPARLWDGPFVRPVPDPANSAFGTRTTLNGQPRSPHSGADFLSAAGTPIKAPNAGRVVLATSLYFTGNTVVIDHGLGLFSLFAHLSLIDVHEGAMVQTGDEVGKVGATGRVTGAHLHWTVRVNGARVDPMSLLSVLGGPETRGR